MPPTPSAPVHTSRSPLGATVKIGSAHIPIWVLGLGAVVVLVLFALGTRHGSQAATLPDTSTEDTTGDQMPSLLDYGATPSGSSDSVGIGGSPIFNPGGQNAWVQNVGTATGSSGLSGGSLGGSVFGSTSGGSSGTAGGSIFSAPTRKVGNPSAPQTWSAAQARATQVAGGYTAQAQQIAYAAHGGQNIISKGPVVA